MISFFRYSIFCFLIAFPAIVNSQDFIPDTVRLSLQDAEKQFLAKNLTLLSEKYNIDIAKAQIIQAKLYANPGIYLEKAVYHTGDILVPAKDQYYAQLQQLIYLGGKRSKLINVQKINAQIAEFEYYDLLRSLRYELRANFFELNYFLKALKVYNERIVSAKNLVTALDEQYKKGNISLKEITRLKALSFSLENEKLNIINNITEDESSLKILTRTNPASFILPLAEEKNLDSISFININLQQLYTTADTGRYDLKMYQANVKLQEANYAYQRSLAVPDVTVGTVYDKAGNYALNYQGFGFGLPLPVFNRNQGNILAAKNLYEKSKTEYALRQSQVQNEVTQAYLKAFEAEKLYKNFDTNFAQDFDKLIGGITDAYEKRNIGLIEFLDYYETYTASLAQLFRLKTTRINAFEQINFSVGTDIMK